MVIVLGLDGPLAWTGPEISPIHTFNSSVHVWFFYFNLLDLSTYHSSTLWEKCKMLCITHAEMILAATEHLTWFSKFKCNQGPKNSTLLTTSDRAKLLSRDDKKLLSTNLHQLPKRWMKNLQYVILSGSYFFAKKRRNLWIQAFKKANKSSNGTNGRKSFPSSSYNMKVSLFLFYFL